MYMDHSLPKRTILEISFLSTTDFYKIDCQVKCNKIREKIFEAPRRESGN